jgi:hypothetical protein
MRIVKRVIIPGVSKVMIAKVIEFISEALLADAKKQFSKSYKFKTAIRPVGENAIETFIQFFPYKYDFIWKINDAKPGYEVVLDARTPGRWRDVLFDMDVKLQGLVDTQWSALTNFFHGYLTAIALRGSGKSPRAHIVGTKKRLREK